MNLIQPSLDEQRKIFNSQGFFNVFETDVERMRDKVSHIRRSFLKKGVIFDFYHDKLLSEILSLGPEYADIMAPRIGTATYEEEKVGGLSIGRS